MYIVLYYLIWRIIIVLLSNTLLYSLHASPVMHTPPAHTPRTHPTQHIFSRRSDYAGSARATPAYETRAENSIRNRATMSL